MWHLTSNLLRQAITTVVVFSLLICCCQAHVLVRDLSGDGEAADAVGSGPSCCESVASCQPDGDPRSGSEGSDDGERDKPGGKGCKSCCVKGSGLKDGAPVLLKAAADLTTLALPVNVTTLPGLDRSDCTPVVDATCCLRVEAMTLVRLHCALIV